MATVVYSFSLDNQEDKDLMRWLDNLPKRERSGEIRKALQAWRNASGGVTLLDLYQAIGALDRKIGSGVVLAHNEQVAAAEPPDIAANLDGLGL